MYKIVIEKKGAYTDITPQNEPIRKTGFYAYERTEISMSYDIRTNERKSALIKMREIKEDGKR